MRHRTILSIALPILVEIGIALAPKVVKDIPQIVYIIALVLIGIAIVALPLWSEWAFVKNLRLRNPFVIKNNSTGVQPQNLSNSHITQQKPVNKLIQVVNAIKEAQEITPNNSDITVYMVNNKWLSAINDRELQDILFKLQEDEKVLTIRSFPDYLLDPYLTDFEKMVKASTYPLKKSFVVNVTDKFGKYKAK